MAINPISTPLPADLPENWQTGQTVAPEGSDVGLSEQYGYNYQSKQINDAQKAVNTIGAQFPNLYGKGDTVQVSDGGTGGKTAAEALLNLGAQPGFNFLVNSRFAYNGRNQQSYAAQAWTVDGWFSPSGSATITLPGGVTVTNAIAVAQPIQQYEQLFGKQATFSAKDMDAIYTVTATMPNSAQGTDSQIAAQATPWGDIAIWNISSLSAFAVVISVSSAATLEAAKLELGTTSTLAADLAQGQDEAIEQLRLDLYDFDPGRPAWILTQNESLLDNAYFVGGGSQQGGGQLPVNQKGQTSYTSAGYGVDRWLAAGSGISVLISDQYIEVSHTGTTSGELQQRIPLTGMQNGAYTFSVLTPENLYAVSGNLDFSSSEFSFSKQLPNSSNIDIRMKTSDKEGGFFTVRWISVNPNSVSLIAAKLELGSRSTLARLVDGEWVLNDPPPNFQQELAKCQRYSLVLRSDHTGSRICVGLGKASNATNCFVFVSTPVSIRKTPVVSFSGTFVLYEQGAVSTSDLTVSSMTVTSYTSNGITLNITSSGLTAGTTYQLWSTAPDAQILLEADL
ncbi:hypothetical protein [Anaeromassilibacillus sp. An200]|uniref:hypothetical protein n=1 Tax=Anaeromassilibacillus sp. An200 TaxID=1965587 RepID=UPI000B385E93|nr:hypothetical protein [Anaeromassilibacillus sp. An200]OUP06241.1 hypothetical protein B5F35_15690 [Anaeromassilibacillus sp. An200]